MFKYWSINEISFFLNFFFISSCVFSTKLEMSSNANSHSGRNSHWICDAGVTNLLCRFYLFFFTKVGSTLTEAVWWWRDSVKTSQRSTPSSPTSYSPTTQDSYRLANLTRQCHEMVQSRITKDLTITRESQALPCDLARLSTNARRLWDGEINFYTQM